MANLLKKLKLLSQATVMISVCAILIFPSRSFADQVVISVVPSSDSIIYEKTIEKIRESINQDNVSLKIIPLKEIENNVANIPGESRLLVTVGQLALEKVINKKPPAPILATLVSRLGFSDILNDSDADDSSLNIGAIFIDQPLDRHLAFTRLALPDNRRLGFLMSKKYRNLFKEFDVLAGKFPPHIVIHEESDNIIQSLNRLMDDADVIVALPDASIFNRRNTHNILLSTYRKLTPVIGHSASFIKAGALAGIHSTPELIGVQTGQVINFLASAPLPKRLPRLYAQYFQVSVNNKVARSLGLPILDKEDLDQKLREIERNNHE